MEKLNKVILALECHYEHPGEYCWEKCPYFGKENCINTLTRDCLEVLRILRDDLTGAHDEIHRLMRARTEENPIPNDWGEYPPEFPREGM